MSHSNTTTSIPQNNPQPWIPTPLIHSLALSKIAGCNIHLKLENLQPSGSFKSRGISKFMLSALCTSPTDQSTHFYSSSGGNAGLACVCAAASLRTRASVIVPLTTSSYMIDKLREAGAHEVVQIGASWAEADAHLRSVVLPEARARGENAVYVHPFDDPEIWRGHATMIPEIVSQLRETRGRDAKPDVIICSVGGGGLFCGVMQGLAEAGMADVPVLAVETEGADSFAQALEKRELITLPGISSIANTLGARRVCARALEYGLNGKVASGVYSDRDAVEGCLLLADKHRFLVEPACGVCIAACTSGLVQERFGIGEESNVVVIVCGGSGVTMDSLEKYRKDFSL